MSNLPVAGAEDDIQSRQRRELLALRSVWGSLECRAIAGRQPIRGIPALRPLMGSTTRSQEAGRTPQSSGRHMDTRHGESNRNRLVRELRELIAALDRRVPHIEREGEVQIALDAAALRARAVARLADLEEEP